MKVATKYSLIAAVLCIVFIFPVDREDNATLSAEEVKCGKDAAYLMFENIIERAFIRDVAVTHKDGDTVYASAYTVGGIPMSQVAVNCTDGSARRQ